MARWSLPWPMVMPPLRPVTLVGSSLYEGSEGVLMPAKKTEPLLAACDDELLAAFHIIDNIFGGGCSP
eukprot:CAMPEP_0173414652 /NCGR_PEP_ID=MMETSP1356-20130122/84442_1 /TAXON_ID=77927 ORGANISM="Hemiselmis virescens, Strain PCC157" /NCGR_SAMPLE_ID=MMETSP1356 /ASSEMBLY_ACC=CAM_ASM_000847 /LENGTH=67 /DNA_ID=CAMNT_0014376851 /DNA_START=526 /DNA_END=725 /DNA_ORIENTATION=-